MAEVALGNAMDGDDQNPPARKKLKVSELPIPQNKRKDIDNLIYKFKKKGHYDDIRRQVFEQFEQHVSTTCVFASLETIRVLTTSFPSPPKPPCWRLSRTLLIAKPTETTACFPKTHDLLRR